jgi:hypothetical protein
MKTCPHSGKIFCARGGDLREENLSAEEAAQKKGARLHEENGNLERKKGFSS